MGRKRNVEALIDALSDVVDLRVRHAAELSAAPGFRVLPWDNVSALREFAAAERRLAQCIDRVAR